MEFLIVNKYTSLQNTQELYAIFNELRNYLAGMAAGMTRDDLDTILRVYEKLGKELQLV